MAKPVQQAVTAVSGSHRQRGRVQSGRSRSAGAGLPAGDRLPGWRGGQAGRHAVRHRAGAVSGAAAAGAGHPGGHPGRLVQAEAEFYRQSTLGKNDFASQSKVDEARAKRDSDKAQILNNQAGVTIAAINLGYTRVTAPFDGAGDRASGRRSAAWSVSAGRPSSRPSCSSIRSTPPSLSASSRCCASRRRWRRAGSSRTTSRTYRSRSG